MSTPVPTQDECFDACAQVLRDVWDEHYQQQRQDETQHKPAA